MSTKINIQSIDALPRLRMALGRFSESVCESVAEAERLVTRSLGRLADACRDREREMHRREDDYDCADPEYDDMSHLAYLRDRARDRYEEARRARNRAAETRREFSSCAQRVREIAGPRLAEAQTLLGQKIVELQGYMAVQPAGYSGGASGISGSAFSGGGNGASPSSPRPSLSEESYADISQIVLPPGFKWVELERLTEEAIGKLNELDDYDRRGVPYDEMKKGLQTFERDILPTMRADPRNTNGESFEDPQVQNMYYVFFGSDPVAVEYSRTTATYTSFASGRHRTRVARDLGWKAIPAKVLGYDRI